MNRPDQGILSRFYRRFILQPLGLSTDNSIVLWLLVFFGVVTGSSLWYFQGNIPVTLSLLYISGIFILSFLRLDYSFYLLIAAVLVFDQFGMTKFTPFTHHAGFFSDIKEIAYLPSFDLGVINPVELQLGFIILSVLFLLAIKEDFTWRPIPVFIPFTLLVFFFAGAFLYGITSGGDVVKAGLEIRAFIYFFLLYLIVPQIIRTRQQIYILGWIIIIAISLKAVQAVIRFSEMDFSVAGTGGLTNREDPVFFMTMLVLLFGLLVFKVKDKQRFYLILLSPLLVLGFYLGLYWGVLLSLLVALTIFIVLLPLSVFVRFMKYAVPFVTVGAVYVLVIWNINSPITQPVQVLKSNFEPPQPEVHYQNYLSELYRDLDRPILTKLDLQKSLIGTGFGRSYEQEISSPPSSQNSDNTSRHGIFWLLVKMGIVGFLAFWFFFNAFIAKAVKVLQRLNDSYLKVFLIVVIVAIINHLAVSYLDLQLTYYRNMIYLGCLMGLLPAMEHSANNFKTGSLTRRRVR